jgi:hypothetical protein
MVSRFDGLTIIEIRQIATAVGFTLPNRSAPIRLLLT